MKKTIIAFGLGLSLFAFSTTFAEGFRSSGVDEAASTVTINLNTAGVAPPAVGYSCPVESTMGNLITFNNAGWDSNTGSFDGLADCFNSAGDYTLTINLVDNAGNTNTYHETFSILPGTPTSGNLGGNCSDKIANNNNYCQLTLKLKDKYGNTVTNQAPRVYADLVSFSDEANTDIQFRDGLRMSTDNATYSAIPANLSSAQLFTDKFYIRAIAPSIGQVGKDLVTRFNGLAEVISRDIDFRITGLKSVKADGTLGTTISPILSSRSLTFSNPFYAKPSLSTLELEKLVTATVATKKEDSSSTITPTVTVKLQSIAGSFCNTDQVNSTETSPNPPSGYLMANENCGPIDYSYPANSIPHTETYDRVFSESDSSVIGPNSTALTTQISYNLGGATVSYPAGGIGGLFSGLNSTTTIGLNGAGINAKFIGADIEGFAAVDEEKSILGTTNNQILNIGINSSKVDIYEEIVKNGWDLARNSANSQTTANYAGNFKDLFGTSNVRVVDLQDQSPGTAATVFSIGGELPSGKNTLVLIDGNLKIASNLSYKDDKDSFGVIILRRNAGKEPAVGNIFVAPGVQKIAGSFFADGGFMNNDGNSVSTGNINEATNTKQLLLEGSLLSRNTLGGSIRKKKGGAAAPDYTPWSDNATNDVARRYDLHYVRRYDYEATPAHSRIEPLAPNGNNAAFIIRPDQKANILPPPGFKLQ